MKWDGTKTGIPNATWGSRMIRIKLCDQIWSINKIFRNPFVVLIAITLPLDQKLQSVAESSAVQDFFHQVLFLTINKDWKGGWRWLPSRNRVFWGWGELNDIKHWVEALQRSGELKTIGIPAHLPLDCERAKSLMRQLGGGPGSPDITCIQVHLVTDPIIWSRGPTAVVVLRHVIFRFCKGCLCFFQGSGHPISEFIH